MILSLPPLNSEHPNAKLIQKFYEDFKNKDYKAMIQAYHPSVEFSDALFDLRGDAAAAMWYMLCKDATDLEVKLVDCAANDEVGVAHREASYNFSETGRRVHNVVEARFEFKDGKIIKHQDDWNFWKWSNMALGLVGRFLGWTPIVKNAAKKKAATKLDNLIEAASDQVEPEYKIPNLD